MNAVGANLPPSAMVDKSADKLVFALFHPKHAPVIDAGANTRFAPAIHTQCILFQESSNGIPQRTGIGLIGIASIALRGEKSLSETKGYLMRTDSHAVPRPYPVGALNADRNYGDGEFSRKNCRTFFKWIQFPVIRPAALGENTEDMPVSKSESAGFHGAQKVRVRVDRHDIRQPGNKLHKSA
jgi:hypothetical protein